ncbi:MAG TPA: PTS glucose transporter subunit IIA [Erysipelothrix sp.]|nr:PTS glucose transporter subunit IIA [Erysipelothrix sp.]
MTKKVVSICNGKLIPLRMVSDKIFSQRLAGDGIGIVPYDSKFVSPVDGVVKIMMKGGHSMVIEQEDGANIMVHIGIQTVNLNGAGITSHIKKGQKVKVGDLLAEIDLEFMQSRKIDLTSVVLVMDPRDVKNLTTNDRGSAASGRTVIIEYEGVVTK